jgi:hypothetical protein
MRTPVRHGLLHYDVHRQRWRSELDELPAEIAPLAGGVDHADGVGKSGQEICGGDRGVAGG